MGNLGFSLMEFGEFGRIGGRIMSWIEARILDGNK